MRITLSARSKILQLQRSGAFRIQMEGSMFAGAHVDLIPNSVETATDVTICTAPLVIVDIPTLTHLTGQVVDYDDREDEFIISNRGNEH